MDLDDFFNTLLKSHWKLNEFFSYRLIYQLTNSIIESIRREIFD